ncbi:MAG: hypothetical protein CEE42_10775 [Promethearchaeota archaeon Loki_b31]|nr:MAG: hypothetical protein CEE42_10775 [Candidatus Lokiarchaeota archaeon Loki_b31]
MRVYLKIHRRNGIDTVACCDELLLNQIFIEGNLKIEISDRFFGGDLLSIDKAVELLKNASYFNIVGENITNKAIALKILSKEGVKKISNIPMAIKMMF